MGILGAFVSAAAALAFAVGPLLRGVMPVNWMFMAGAVLLTINSLYILFFLKDAGGAEKSSAPQKGEIAALLGNRIFVTMNAAAFLNNFMMMSVFYAAPIYMDQVTGQNGMWKIFVPAIIAAILFMRAAMGWINKGFANAVLLCAFALSSVSVLFYLRPASFLSLLLGTALFLCGYITIATAAATRANEVLEDNLRGTGNGIFNSFQYIGSFGGALATGAVWGISQRVAWLTVIAVGMAGFLILLFNKPSKAEKPEKGDLHA